MATSGRWLDRGQAHRAEVLARIKDLWEAHPDHSFCDLIDSYVISIGTMAGHTTDADVVECCPPNPSKFA